MKKLIILVVSVMTGCSGHLHFHFHKETKNARPTTQPISYEHSNSSSEQDTIEVQDSDWIRIGGPNIRG